MVKTSKMMKVCGQMVLLASVRTWSVLTGDLGNLISCYIYRNSPRKGSQDRGRWANAATWKQLVVCGVSASNNPGPLQFTRLGLLLSPNPFHLALMIFFHIYSTTLLLFIKKVEENHCQGGNNIIKLVNLCLPFFLDKFFSLPCCVLFIVLFWGQWKSQDCIVII